MIRELTLILGGARSGKSRLAEKLAARCGPRVLYIATAQARDSEMQTRIEVHQRARPLAWRTVEAPVEVAPAIRGALQASAADVVLLDCLTLLVSNVILQGLPQETLGEVLCAGDEAVASERVSAELDALLQTFHEGTIPWLVVSNEVGLGLVPPFALGRVYRDLLGWANQRVATAADHVYLVVAGLPLDLKALSAADEPSF